MCSQVRVELYDVRRTKFIQAHTSALACIALSQDGKMLATASERGTLVRIHSTTEGTKLQVRHPSHEIHSQYADIEGCHIRCWAILRLLLSRGSLCSQPMKSTVHACMLLLHLNSSLWAIISQELRRGADPACIYSIAFSKGDRPHWLALSSDKGTVHVFSLDQRQPSPEAGAAATNDAGSLRNPVSPFSFVSVSSLSDPLGLQ